MDMMSHSEQALSALNTLVTQGGNQISDGDLIVFKKKPDEAEQHGRRLAEIYDAMFRGFFHCAAKGLTLVPEKGVTERFGQSIEENYPEANEIFLRFARTYWTLRVLVYELMEHDMEWIGAHLLGKLEQDIGPVFFSFPGAVRISPSKREKFQRELIEESGAHIDIDEFIKGNPILIRDKSTRRGCLGISLSLLLIIVTLALIIKFITG